MVSWPLALALAAGPGSVAGRRQAAGATGGMEMVDGRGFGPAGQQVRTVQVQASSLSSSARCEAFVFGFTAILYCISWPYGHGSPRPSGTKPFACQPHTRTHTPT